LAGGAMTAAEFHGIWVNAQQRRELAQGLREQVDYVHRTITEVVLTLAALHPDSVNAPFAKLRRLALLVLIVWMLVHFFTNGKAM